MISKSTCNSNILACLILFLLWLPTQQLYSQQDIRINELVASNSFLQDEDRDTPDWIELFNMGSDPINLKDWSLSDRFDSILWVFPDIEIANGAYLLVWASGKNRNEINSVRTLVNRGDDFRYIIPTQAVSEQWTLPGFDDNTWSTSSSGFGYGDNDDATVVSNGTGSIFLRKEFNIENPSQIQELIFNIDYDDGFVAYLNGAEIGRANMNGYPPAYNSFAVTDHEAVMYNGGYPDQIELLNDGILLEGNNVLSIQAHNVSNGSSDMTVIPFLSARYEGQSNDGIEPPEQLELTSEQLHTNFKISSGGESVYLRKPNNELVDSISFLALPANVSLGRKGSNPASVYFDSPSPSLENVGPCFEELNNDRINFSHDGGLVNNLSLSMSTESGEGEIRYTLDSSEPNSSSSIYSSEISISSSTIVRAKIFKENSLSPTIETRSYLNSNHDLPVLSLVTEPDNFFNESEGIYTFGPDHETNFPYFGANFWNDWEKPISFSIYNPTDQLAFNMDGGVKIFGGWSRALDQRSLSIFARRQYGASEINYPLFVDRSYERFQSLVLRNSGNDWLNANIRDASLTTLMAGSGIDYQAYQPVSTYINGSYWGMYNMREKISEHYLASRYETHPDSIDLLELNGFIIHGSNEEYLTLIQFIDQNDLFFEDNFEYVADQIDIDNFILYQVAQIYFNNQDWPGNNIKFYKIKGGKWRWILFDTDFGFGTWDPSEYNEDTIEFALEPFGGGWPNPPWSTLLFRKLRQNTSFSHDFINRFADELNTRFLPSNVRNHIDEINDHIANEIPKHYNRWNGSLLYQNQQVNAMKNFANLRPANIKEFILEEFNLPRFNTIQIENQNTNQGWVQINNRLVINQEFWEGDYFETVPIRLEAIPNPGFTFSHWEGDINFSEAVLLLDVNQISIKLVPVFNESEEERNIIINEINYKSAEDHDTGDWIELHNPNPFSMSLHNYKIGDDTNLYNLPEGTEISADGFYILARNQEAFSVLHPDIEQMAGDLNFGLASEGDVVKLYNPENILIDSIRYSSVTPWSLMANGQGYTLELRDPNLNNDFVENWDSVHFHGSPGETNLLSDATNNISKKTNWLVYPNPAQTEIRIYGNENNGRHITMRIFGADGKEFLIQKRQAINQSNLQFEVDISHLPKGPYILQIQTDNQEPQAMKLVIVD